MRLLRRGPEKTSPEVKTPVVVQEHVFKSHPLDVDSDSEVGYSTLAGSAGRSATALPGFVFLLMYTPWARGMLHMTF